MMKKIVSVLSGTLLLAALILSSGCATETSAPADNAADNAVNNTQNETAGEKSETTDTEDSTFKKDPTPTPTPTPDEGPSPMPTPDDALPACPAGTKPCGDKCIPDAEQCNIGKERQ